MGEFYDLTGSGACCLVKEIGWRAPGLMLAGMQCDR
jgi:hypothetical protein